MDAEQSGLVKKDRVRITGSRALAAGAAGAVSPAPSARIVEKNDSGAMVEVVCACGRKIHLHCRYGQLAPDRAPNPEPAKESEK
jgi:hypothetical protein